MKAICSVIAVAMVALAVSQAHAGSGSVRSTEACVAAYSVDSYTVWFHGGETAVIGLKGYGSYALALEVYDEYGNLLWSGTDASGQAIASIYVFHDGPFVIKVVNRSCVTQCYILATN